MLYLAAKAIELFINIRPITLCTMPKANRFYWVQVTSSAHIAGLELWVGLYCAAGDLGIPTKLTEQKSFRFCHGNYTQLYTLSFRKLYNIDKS